MPTSPLNRVVHYLRGAVGSGPTDGQLLDGFITRKDEAAFEALVRRYGSMVMGVCRRILRNQHDAEDAFQATFLVLVRKAAFIRSKELVGNWLYGVARQTAWRAKIAAGKRRAKERQLTELPEPETAQADCWADMIPLLDQELSRLPEKYRVAIVFCDLGGKTHKEAARQLNCPEGTLSARLARARVMLGKRLARQGLSVSAGPLATVPWQNTASASVPNSLLVSTIKAASLIAAGQAATDVMISAQVAALTEGVLKSMLLTKVKIAMGVALAVTVCVAGGMIAGTSGMALSNAAASGPKAQVALEKVQREEGDEKHLREEVRRLKEEVETLKRKLREQSEVKQVRYRGKPTSYWIEALSDREENYRAEAVKALGSIGEVDQSVIPVLVDVLPDPSTKVQGELEQALRQTGSHAIPALTDALKSKNPVIQMNAARVILCQFTSESDRAMKVFSAALQNRDKTVRKMAYTNLPNIVAYNKSAGCLVPFLLENLERDASATGNYDGPAWLLGLMGPRAKEALPALVEILKSDRDERVKISAAMALEGLRAVATPAIPALREASTKDASEKVRNAAKSALNQIPP